MKILVRQALIKDNNSSHNNTVKDILVSDGIITDISPSINAFIEGEMSVMIPSETRMSLTVLLWDELLSLISA